MHIPLQTFGQELAGVLRSLSARVRRHRLLVVLPVVALLVCVTAWEGQRPRIAGSLIASSNVIGPLAQDQQWALPSGERFHLVQGAVIEQSGSLLRLRSGEALFAPAGLQRVQAGAYTLTGWSGGFSAIVSGADVTVVPLTTPVLIEQGEGRFVVPLRTQWRGAGELPPFAGDVAAWEKAHALLPVPEAYLHTQLARARDLAERAVSSLMPVLHTPAAFIDLLRLPAAKERADALRDEAQLTALALSLESADREASLSILRQARDAGVLAAADDVAAFLAIAAPQRLGSWFLPAFTAWEDQWLLASLHPLLRDEAWVLPPPDAGKEARLVRLVMLPQSDIDAEGAASATIERWGNDLLDFVHAQPESLALFGQLLVPLQTAIDHQLALGYPRRAREYAAATLKVAQTLEGEHAAEAAAILAHLGAVEKEPLPPVAPSPAPAQTSSVASASSSSSAPSLSPAEAEQRTRVVLQQLGALFTVQTRILGRSDGTAWVEDIGFSTPQGDELLDFSYDPAQDGVSDIVRGEQTFPYTVTLGEFVRWIQGE